MRTEVKKNVLQAHLMRLVVFYSRAVNPSESRWWREYWDVIPVADLS